MKGLKYLSRFMITCLLFFAVSTVVFAQIDIPPPPSNVSIDPFYLWLLLIVLNAIGWLFLC